MNKVVVTLRNPNNKEDTLDYIINVSDTPMGELWYTALKDLLRTGKYLEKNFCFLGFPDNPRSIEYICNELNKAADQINKFFGSDYNIDEVYTPTFIQKLDKSPNQVAMNVLHNHFERLQGTVWELSDYYKRADYETKFAIRQLNNLCHEAESLMLSQRKQIEAPDWIRPSQITTFLNAERLEFPAEHKTTFDETRYDRVFGGVYLHWTQIGKTLYEVYRDEGAPELDATTCEAITHLRFYSGEFDIEWAQSVTYDSEHPWHAKEVAGFKEWLVKNNIDLNDTEYNFGYHKVGQIDMSASFGTINYRDVWPKLSDYLNIYKIQAGEVVGMFDYAYTDPDYKQQQIERLKPGYDYSSGR